MVNRGQQGARLKPSASFAPRSGQTGEQGLSGTPWFAHLEMKAEAESSLPLARCHELDSLAGLDALCLWEVLDAYPQRVAGSTSRTSLLPRTGAKIKKSSRRGCNTRCQGVALSILPRTGALDKNPWENTGTVRQRPSKVLWAHDAARDVGRTAKIASNGAKFRRQYLAVLCFPDNTHTQVYSSRQRMLLNLVRSHKIWLLRSFFQLPRCHVISSLAASRHVVSCLAVSRLNAQYRLMRVKGAVATFPVHARLKYGAWQ